MALVFDCCDPNGNSETMELRKLTEPTENPGGKRGTGTHPETHKPNKTFGVDVLYDGGGIVAGANASNGLAGV